MKFSCLIILFSWFVMQINAEFHEDTWVDPDAWARDHLSTDSFPSVNSKCCKCSDIPADSFDPGQKVKEEGKKSSEDVASLLYFKKLVTMLFNRKTFKYDSKLQHYERSLVFTLQSHQLDKLEELQDPRDLDKILAEVFNNARTPNVYCGGEQILHARDSSTGIRTIVYNILSDVLQLMKTSEIRFLLVVMIVILTAWLINNRFKIGWLPLIAGGIFLYGYLHTYLECNRELEVTQMLEILNGDVTNTNNAKASKIINFLKGIFYSEESQVLQQQKIKQSSKLAVGFCRPDHVLLMYFNDIFLKYIQVLMEQCSVTLTTLSSGLGFPYNLLSPFVFVFLIGYVLKLIFKYLLSPSAWAELVHRKHAKEKSIKNAKISEDDRLSGDNLKLLLNAINAAPHRNIIEAKVQNSSGVSGVEDLAEAIESSSEKTSVKLDKSEGGKNQNNNSDLKIENLSDDS